jgi:hypothetical protein
MCYVYHVTRPFIGVADRPATLPVVTVDHPRHAAFIAGVRDRRSRCREVGHAGLATPSATDRWS